MSDAQLQKRDKLLVIVGATAVGKTSLSLEIAERFDGEIISADSRLFYRGMDIGTAKPSPAEQARAVHHLIDIADPDETITLGDYQERAYAAINSVQQRGRLPILVGGTGQYVMAVVEGWGIPRVAPQPELRAELRQLDSETLHAQLQQLDPQAAAKIHPNNVRRVVRALEVCIVSGRPISELQQKRPPDYDIMMLGLMLEREALYERIDRRVDQMIENGLLQELERLQQAGYKHDLPAFSGLGYRQLFPYLHGEITLAQAVADIKTETHRLVRHQHNWFGNQPHIIWFDVAQPNYPQVALSAVAAWLELRQ